jgi:hypothetical protein
MNNTIMVDFYDLISYRNSSSIFSSLMLANVEQQMQFDPSANISTDFGLWESPREKKVSVKTENETQNSQLNESIETNNSSINNEESDDECFHIDPYVSSEYQISKR